MSLAGPDDAVGATVEIVPVAEHHAAGLRACLGVVARERRYLAQVEARSRTWARWAWASCRRTGGGAWAGPGARAA